MRLGDTEVDYYQLGGSGVVGADRSADETAADGDTAGAGQ
jgi:hypothetical protein